MNENETTVSAEAEVSAFDSGWDDYDAVPEYSSPDTTTDDAEETSEEAETESETDGANQTTETQEEPAETETKSEETEQTFELNYMGNKESVGRNEMIALAQKGKDYDRIHGKLDAANTELETLRGQKANYDKYESFLKNLAQQSGTDIQGLMDSVAAKMMVNDEAAKGNTITEEFALQRVKLDRERAEFEAQKNAKSEPAQQAEPAAETAPDAEKAKRQDEFLAFTREYPDVKPEDIPKEVWAEFNSGKSLVGAYSKFENKKLRERLAAAEQNTKNRERSTGSRDSAGAGKQKDAFDAGWDFD